jgi:hypothetical protein
MERRNKMKRKVNKVVNSRDVMMGDIRIGQPLPANELEQISPFILLHHGAPKKFEPGEAAIEVAPHPHRGFEPVTFIFKGEIEHHDSRGNHNIVRDGGVQWLTAGMGIIHSEKGSKAFQEKGGVFEMIQLWINLPKKLKMVQPNYQAFQRDAIPFYEEKNSRINVISGEIKGLKGPFKSLTNVIALTVEMEPGGEVTFDIPESRNILLYQLHGNIGDKQLVEFEKKGTEVTVVAENETLILLLAGDPIVEPMVQHGPFVMNTQTEIMEAMRDYQTGKMGFLSASEPESSKPQLVSQE